MNARLDVGLVVLGAAFALSGALRSRSVLSAPVSGPVRASDVALNAPMFPVTDSLDDAAATIVANDPFRLSNVPPQVRYLSPATMAVVNVPVRPALIVRAIIGGPPWSALVEGIPGQTGGVVVVVGNTFDKLRIRAIARDTVVVQAPDTTWKLTMAAP
ncbi:MAG: hypothetical protein ABJE10_24470 [bacterium]